MRSLNGADLSNDEPLAMDEQEYETADSGVSEQSNSSSSSSKKKSKHSKPAAPRAVQIPRLFPKPFQK